jgi:hypothetical protein
MFTFRNVFALVLFLFGTTFLWLTPAFLGDKQTAAQGAIWTVVIGINQRSGSRIP